MSDDTIRLVTIGRIFRRRWRLLTVLAVVGALLGYGVSLLVPARYTASASVLLPGAWEERELLTQAEIAASSVVVDRAASALGWTKVSRTELREQVTAKATDGNIIRISGTADTPERAQRLSDQVAQQFVAFAARISGDSSDPEAAARPEALRQLVTQTSRRITELADAAGRGQSVESVQTRTELSKLRTTLQEAVDKLVQADPAANKSLKANMVVMGPAPRPTGEAPPTRTQLVVTGAVLFLLLGVVGHLTALRMSRRARTGAEIAAALGAVVLGTVDVPAERPADRPGGRGPKAGIGRLLALDVRWDVPAPSASGDEAGRQLRYRRVHARLRDGLRDPRRVLLLVPEGDRNALRAAEQFTAGAEGDPQLRVAGVPVAGPVIADRDDESGAVVLLSPGSWTTGELAGIAGACADAGHEIVGIVLVGTVQAGPAKSAGRSRKAAAPAVAVGADATGSSG
ncbi:Wzz/FepE/Etk N-terminal domain-containing protein [Streptomyces sp. NPDC090077]|uniref:Wzz/FepE/Etk N-terminal domain-containing protein n=1 Tax=Streptomyces sp. NPDC090077 TaxID=3365938 RepID=UPI00382EB0C5